MPFHRWGNRGLGKDMSDIKASTSTITVTTFPEHIPAPGNSTNCFIYINSFKPHEAGAIIFILQVETVKLRLRLNNWSLA